MYLRTRTQSIVNIFGGLMDLLEVCRLRNCATFSIHGSNHTESLLKLMVTI